MIIYSSKNSYAQSQGIVLQMAESKYTKKGR